ncbi:transcriptional repressor LexA [Romboutsia sp.]|uniref:transcriptional repressor LexA n=1 Tax=Romboutsia sp. TaxID=1965302 RepID=UPI003F316E1C
MEMRLSKSQLRVLNFVKEQIELNGFPPSVREICDGIGLKSPSTVHTHLKSLEIKGYIKKNPTQPRALAILRVPRCINSNLEEYVDTAMANTTTLPGVKTDDLNGFFHPVLVSNPYISIFKYKGQSIDWANISTDDYVFVDTSRNFFNNDLVLAVVNGEYSTIKKYFNEGNTIKLTCDKDSEEYILANPENVTIHGVVMGSFKNFDSKPSYAYV